jgi:TatA/E family protein of Tat protein translocase
MPQIGPAEILVILVVALLVFGPHRLPEIGRQVGRGMRELRRFQDTVRGELDEVLHLHEDATPAVGPEPPSLPPVEGAAPLPGPAATPAAPPAGSPAGARAPSRFRAPGNPAGA